MYIECHKAEILRQWEMKDGHLVGGTVLVEFSLYDETSDNRRLCSRLIEHVCLRIDPEYSEQFRTRRLGRRACEQIRRYFDGEGERENLFSDGPDSPREFILTPMQEAELEAELRLIELEFENPALPAPEPKKVHAERQAAPVA